MLCALRDRLGGKPALWEREEYKGRCGSDSRVSKETTRLAETELRNCERESSDYKEPEMNPERPRLDSISNREPLKPVVQRRGTKNTKYPMFYKWESVKGQVGVLRTHCNKPSQAK